MLGLERTLMILRGVLRVQDLDAQRSVFLSPQSAPFVFAGSAAIHAEPMGAGRVEDFNVMSRTGDCSHVARRLSVVGAHNEPLMGDWMLIYHEGGAPVRIDQSTERVLDERAALLVAREGKSEEIVRLSATQAALIVVHINQIRRMP